MPAESRQRKFLYRKPFPGSVSYHYDYNSTGTFGLPTTPNFTTQGNGQGFGINWSALFPDWPTLSVGYQHGSGSGTLYGTDQKTSSDQRLSTCDPAIGWVSTSTRITITPLNGNYPEILTGTANLNDSGGYDTGINASRNIALWNGAISANYSHSPIRRITSLPDKPRTIRATRPTWNPQTRISVPRRSQFLPEPELHQQSVVLLQPGLGQISR